MTDLKDVFEDEDLDGDQELDARTPADEEIHPEKDDSGNEDQTHSDSTHEALEAEPGDELQDSDSDAPKEEKKRKRKAGNDPLVGKKKKGRNEIDAEASFFSGL